MQQANGEGQPFAGRAGLQVWLFLNRDTTSRKRTGRQPCYWLRAMTTHIKLGDQIKQALQSAGMAYGLRFLHNTTPYRFTALFHVRDHVLRNLQFFDRENPSSARRPAELPITAAYCIFPYSTETQCEIADAASDSRTTDHPMRERIASYIGSPLIDEKGSVFGTLCHFDVEPVVPTEEVRETLRDVAGFLGRNMASLC
jgi:hypothetical protein